MTGQGFQDLGLQATSGGGCACCSPTSHGTGAKDTGTPVQRTAAGETVSAQFLVEGMTCSHCVRSVTEEVSAIEGVSDVAVDLHAGNALERFSKVEVREVGNVFGGDDIHDARVHALSFDRRRKAFAVAGDDDDIIARRLLFLCEGRRSHAERRRQGQQGDASAKPGPRRPVARMSHCSAP